MKVLMITGDKNILTPGTRAYERFALQRAAVERLEAVYWGKNATRPVLPEGAFDVVTVQDPFWRGLFALRVARRLGATCNVQVHTDLSKQSFFRRLLARLVLRRADSVRVVSQKLAGQVARFGVRVPIRVLPVYADLARFRALVRHPHETPTVLWIGRFEKEKDPLLALAVFKQVLAARGDAGLVMLGTGTMDKKVRQQAAGLPVAFPGWQDPAPYLASADVVLCTSKHESYGVSIVEALAAGVPVVSPDVGIAKEAGALVADRSALSSPVLAVLRDHPSAVLQIPLLTAEQWVTEWKASLL